MLSLKGKGVCGGVTLGTLAVLRRNAAAVKRRKVQNAEAEVARFQTARQDAIDKLAELYEKAVADVGKDNAAIFEIHQMMLEDLDYIESVEGIIRTQQVNAEYAVQTIAANFAEIFSSMEDDYMRARAADVKDISNKVLGCWVMQAAAGKAAVAVTFWQRMTWHPVKPYNLINRVCRAL